MSGLQFSPKEIKLIRTVIVFSCIGCLMIVGGTWLFFRIQLNRHITQQKKARKLNASTEIQPVDIDAHRTAAFKYMQAGIPEKALPHLERIHALYSKDPEILSDLAFASLEAGRYGQALEFYDRLLELSGPESISASQCARRGIALFYLNRVDESSAALHGCMDRFPANAETYCFLGQIEAYRNLPSEKAVDYFNRSIALDSTYTEAWYQLARYYMIQKVYPKARELLLKAVTINPFHSKSHSRLGMVYYYLDYPELAKKSYQTSLVLNPHDFNTCYNFGELLYGVLGDTVEALKYYKRAYTLNPKLYEASFKIGLICMGNRMFKEAVKYFEEALLVAPDEVRILLQCAVAWERLGRVDKAMECYRRVLTYDELNGVARQKLKLLAAR